MKYKVEFMVDVPNNYKKEFPDLSPQAYIAQELGWLESSMGVELIQISRAISLKVLTDFIASNYPNSTHAEGIIFDSIFDPEASAKTLINILDENDSEWSTKFDKYWSDLYEK